MKIETERLVITELQMDMIADIQKNSLDEDNRLFVPDEVYETLEQARKVVTWLIRSYACKDGPFVYPVLLKNKVNIGYVQACSIQDGWEVGYHIAKQYTGNGYATEALKAFLPYIFKELKINSIHGIVLEENIASQKILEKSGFLLEFWGTGNYQNTELSIRRYVYSANMDR